MKSKVERTITHLEPVRLGCRRSEHIRAALRRPQCSNYFPIEEFVDSLRDNGIQNLGHWKSGDASAKNDIPILKNIDSGEQIVQRTKTHYAPEQVEASMVLS